MKKKICLFISIFLVVVQTSCDKDYECDGENSKVRMEAIPSAAFLKLKNIDESKSEVSIIISSQDDYHKFVVSETTLPDIDFSKTILLAVKVKRTGCAEDKGQSLVLRCDRIVHNVMITTEICQKPTDVYFFALIDMKYKDYRFELNVTES